MSNTDQYPESTHYVNRKQSKELRRAKYAVAKWLGFTTKHAQKLRDLDKRSFVMHLTLQYKRKKQNE